MFEAALTMFEGAWLAIEAQQVIALRLMHLAMGGPAATVEAQLMVSEKVAASMAAAGLMAAAAGRGTADGGADAVVRMLRQRVRANRTRLWRLP